MFTNAAEARNLPSAKAVVDEFRKGGFEPEGYTLSTYAAVQVWAAAVTKGRLHRCGEGRGDAAWRRLGHRHRQAAVRRQGRPDLVHLRVVRGSRTARTKKPRSKHHSM